MSEGVVVELIYTPPVPFDVWIARIDDESDFDGQEQVEAAYNAYRQHHQPWRWIAKSAGNNEPLAKSTESYFNEDDCRHAIGLLFGSATPARLTVEYRDGRVKSEVLR